MKVLIIGQGGREHALTWKTAQSNQVTEIFVAPGNAGTAQEAKTKNININSDDANSLLEFAQSKHIDLTIVGPEVPLVNGLVDLFQKNNLNVLGPNQRAAMLEGSKAFCKQILTEANVATAKYAEFTDVEAAKKYIKNNKTPIVIKADGLAAGKGVTIAHTEKEALNTVEDFLTKNTFGDASNKVIIEQYLTGIEASFIALISNNKIIPLAGSQDHKTRDNNDQGPNTGGMGAFSPTPTLTANLTNKVIVEIIEPTIKSLEKHGITYSGFLYAGLMVDNDNNINVLEYNCRLGDPETQVILPRIESDFFDLCYKAATNNIPPDYKIKWSSKSAVTVVLASRDYPNTPIKNEVISGLEIIDDIDNNNNTIKVFHAGTKQDGDEIKTNGGRVVAVTALANNIKLAQELAYSNANKISWPSMFYRTDIAAKAL